MPATIREYRDEDVEAMLDVVRECYPLFPQSTAGEFRQSHRRRSERDLVTEYWVAEQDGEIPGAAEIGQIESDEPNLYYVEVLVRPGSRDRGFGGELLRQILDSAERLGVERAVCFVHDDQAAGLAFAAKHGFAPNGACEQLSGLEVASANLDGFDDVERNLTQQGVRIELLRRYVDDDEFMHDLYRLDMDTHRDIPSSVPWKDMPYDYWLDQAVLGPGRSADWAWVATDAGRPVGMARLRVYADGRATNAYTGVRDEHRGRGLARALKHRTVQWCRENGVSHIFTGNEERNTRMLAINMSLGYQPLPKAVEVERRFDR